MSDLLCEVCGQPADCKIADVDEIEPVKDPDGNLWRQYRVKSTHLLCEAHWRPPQGGSCPPPDATGYWQEMANMENRRKAALEKLGEPVA